MPQFEFFFSQNLDFVLGISVDSLAGEDELKTARSQLKDIKASLTRTRKEKEHNRKVVLSSFDSHEQMFDTLGLDGGLFHGREGESPTELNLRMLREVGSALTYLGDEEARVLQDPVYAGICQPVLDLMTANEAREFQDKITNWDQEELDDFFEDYTAVNEDWLEAQQEDSRYDVHHFISNVQGDVGRFVQVEEKFPQEKFRVLSEMRFLGKIRVAILDFVGYVDFLAKFGAKLDFRV